MFDSISLQPTRNITTIKNTSESTTKKKCPVNYNQINYSDILVKQSLSFPPTFLLGFGQTTDEKDFLAATF